MRDGLRRARGIAAAARAPGDKPGVRPGSRQASPATGSLHHSDHVATIAGGSLQQIRSIDTHRLTDLRHLDIVIASDGTTDSPDPTGPPPSTPRRRAPPRRSCTPWTPDSPHLVQRLHRRWTPRRCRYAATPGPGPPEASAWPGCSSAAAPSVADYFLDLRTRKESAGLRSRRHRRRPDWTTKQRTEIPAIIARRAGRIPVIAVVGRSDIQCRRAGRDRHPNSARRSPTTPTATPPLTPPCRAAPGRTRPDDPTIPDRRHKRHCRPQRRHRLTEPPIPRDATNNERTVQTGKPKPRHPADPRPTG